MRKFRSALLVLLALFLSCVKEDAGRIKALKDRAFAFELVNSKFLFADLLKAESGFSYSGSGNSVLTLMFSSAMNSEPASSVFQTGTAQKTVAAALSPGEINQLSTSGSVNLLRTDSVQFTFPNNAKIKKLKVKSGTMRLNIDSRIMHHVNLGLTFPYVTNSAAPFSDSIQINYTSVLPVLVSKSYDISGFTFDLASPSNSFNNAVLNLAMRFQYLGNNIGVNDSIRLSFSFENLQFTYAEGFPGNFSFSVNQSEIVNHFQENMTAGVFIPENPKLKLTFSNSYGFPLSADSLSVAAISSDIPVASLTSSAPLFPVPFLYPTIAQAGQTKTKIITYTTANSNLKNLVALARQAIQVRMKPVASPSANTFSYFFTDTSRYSIVSDLEIPLQGDFSGVVLKDTFPVSVKNFSSSREMIVKTTVSNGLPFSLGMQFIFLDESKTVIDSLFDSEIQISAALYKTNGALETAGEGWNSITVPTEKIERLKTAKFVSVRAGNFSVSTSSMIPAHAFIQFRMGVISARE